VDWAEPSGAATSSTGRAVGRASVVSGTETDAFRRIERLERELVQLRGGDRVAASNGPGRLLSTSAYAGPPLAGAVAATQMEPAPAVTGNGTRLRGRAAVVPRPAPVPAPTGTAPPPPQRRVPRPDARTLKLGGGWTWLGGIFAFTCWSIWAVANRPANLIVP